VIHLAVLEIQINIGLDPVLRALLQALVNNPTAAVLARIEQKVDHIMATEQQVLDGLAKIDAATTKIAGNVQVVADVLQTVSTEVDALEAALLAAGVSQGLVDQVSAIGDRAQAASDALDAQVPVLQAIAAKGVINPVPVAPPVTPTV
jgi:predicted GTPase